MYMPEVTQLSYVEISGETLMKTLGYRIEAANIADKVPWLSIQDHPAFQFVTGADFPALSDVIGNGFPQYLLAGETHKDVNGNDVILTHDYRLYYLYVKDNGYSLEIGVDLLALRNEGMTGVYLTLAAYENVEVGGLSDYYHDVTGQVLYSGDWQANHYADSPEELSQEDYARVNPRHWSGYYNEVSSYSQGGFVVKPPYGLFLWLTQAESTSYVTYGPTGSASMTLASYEAITEIEDKEPELILIEAMESVGLTLRYWYAGGLKFVEVSTASRYQPIDWTYVLPYLRPPYRSPYKALSLSPALAMLAVLGDKVKRDRGGEVL